jgi:hypothetical protein
MYIIWICVTKKRINTICVYYLAIHFGGVATPGGETAFGGGATKRDEATEGGEATFKIII